MGESDFAPVLSSPFAILSAEDQSVPDGFFFLREVASLLPFLTLGHLSKVFVSLCVQIRSYLPAAIPEQALHWWHSDPAAESSLGHDFLGRPEEFLTTIEHLSLKCLIIL